MVDKAPRGRILIVDDDHMMCMLLTEKLLRAGFECQSCTGAEHALLLMERQKFDLVTMDLLMPGVTGLELLEAARQKHPHTAYVVVTGVDEISVGIQAMKQGAFDYLTKPLDLEALVRTVERALEKKSPGT